MLFLDLDDFKVVNDGFGHEAGDRLLIQVARAAARRAVREADLVARLGGDEFTVLCRGLEDPSEATITAGRIRAALSAPFDVAGQRRHVRVSIGCRVAAPGEADPDALLRDADSAMYQAKGAGKDRVELFSDATRARLLRRIEIEQQLRAALDERRAGSPLPAAGRPRDRAAWSASRRSRAGARRPRWSSSRWRRRPG